MATLIAANCKSAKVHGQHAFQCLRVGLLATVLKTNYGRLSFICPLRWPCELLRCLVLFHRLRKLAQFLQHSPQPHVNGSISRLLFSRILVAKPCAVIVLRLKGVIANFHVVSGLKRHFHRVITLVHWWPAAGTRALVIIAGILRWRLRSPRWWDGFRHGWRIRLAGTAAAPAPDAKDVGQWVRIAVLLVGLLLVYLGDDVFHRAISGARWRRGLRKHPCAEENHR